MVNYIVKRHRPSPLIAVLLSISLIAAAFMPAAHALMQQPEDDKVWLCTTAGLVQISLSEIDGQDAPIKHIVKCPLCTAALSYHFLLPGSPPAAPVPTNWLVSQLPDPALPAFRNINLLHLYAPRAPPTS